MKIAFFTIGYSGMYGDLIDEFAANGHQVTVIQPTSEGKSRMEESGPLRILRFKTMQLLNVSIVKKGIANLMMPYDCLRAVKKYLKSEEFDLILMTTAPMGFFKGVKYLKEKNEGSIFYLILRDIYPEVMQFIGLHKFLPVYNYFRRIAIKLYKLSDIIGCMSLGNIQFITERYDRYINTDKLTMLPNWLTPVEYVSSVERETVKERYGVGGKFLLAYGGNMGIPQGLDILLELARIKEDRKDVVFLFVGDGTDKTRLEKKTREMNLSNVIFTGKLPRNEYDELIRSCDVGFISLHPKIPTPNIPSKTLSYYNCRTPILASVDPVTDYGIYQLDGYNTGLWSLATDMDSISMNFDVLYNDPELRRQMGENGYNCLANNFSTARIYDSIMETVGKYE